MGDNQNQNCPSYESHYENACDVVAPGVELLSPEQDEMVLEMAQAEYLACEGH